MSVTETPRDCPDDVFLGGITASKSAPISPPPALSPRPGIILLAFITPLYSKYVSSIPDFSFCERQRKKEKKAGEMEMKRGEKLQGIGRGSRSRE